MIDDCKSKLPLPLLWAQLGLPSPEKVKSGATVRSPFREDKTPSLYVKRAASGKWWWEDKATGVAGDEVTLLEEAKELSNLGAIQLYHELAGIPLAPSPRPRGSGSRRPRKPQLPQDRAAHVDSDRVRDFRSVGVPLSRAEREAPHPNPPAGYTLTQIYDYVDAAGRILHQTLRFTWVGEGEPTQGRKTFRQRRPVRAHYDADLEHPKRQGVWIYSLDAPDFEPVPYRLPQLLAQAGRREAPLYLVEGEKDADTLAELGLDVTTLPMGAGKWRPSFQRYFQDLRVVILADFDPVNPQTGERPGTAAALRLAAELQRAGARQVALLHLPALWPACPEGVDISDLVAQYRRTLTAEETRSLLVEDFLAAAQPPPPELLWEGIHEEGSRGGIVIRELALARRLVYHHDLVHSGDTWWQWRRPGRPNAGTWEPVLEEERLASWAMEALDANPVTRPKVTSPQLASILKLMESVRFRHPDGLNCHDEFLINCRSGMLDARSGEVLPHGEQHYSTVQIPVTWDPEAPAPLWLDSVLPTLLPEEDDRSLLQEIFGYCIVPAINYHKFFLFFGDGGTGKGTTVELLTSLVGFKNAYSLQLQELGSGFVRENLVGKQLYLCKELTADSFKHIGLIKAITSGDPISVDVKYGRGYTFRPKGRFIMESNVAAFTPDASDGFGRRFVQLDFRHQIPEEEKDFQLQQKLQGELPGVFAWAVQGFQRLYERGRFQHSAGSARALAELQRQRSQVKSFLEDPAWVTIYADEDESEEALAAYVNVSELWEAHLEWCQEWNIVSPYCGDREKGPGIFLREALSRRPDLRARKRDNRDPVTRKRDGSRLLGVRLLKVS